MMKKFHLILILIGSVTWSLTMIKSGIVYSYGMGFWGPNGHDGIWHIALSKGLSRGNWGMPVYSGEIIKNYHIGYDLFLSSLHKITLIPIVNLYFQVIPVVMSLLLGYSAYIFLFKWTKSHAKSILSLFFIYFGGSLGYIVTFIQNGRFDGESMFWANQSISSLINPPYALSLIILFFGLYFLLNGLTEANNNSLIIATFLFGILIQIKAYAGILILGGLFVSGLLRIVRSEGIKLFKVFLGSLLISLFLYAAFSKGFENFLILKPFWFLESMMATSDRLNWPEFATAMQIYKENGFIVKLVIAYSAAFIIFVIGNFGTRIISFIKIIKFIIKPKSAGFMDVIIITMIASGIVLPMFLIQKGNSWNSIQFLYYSLVFSGIYAGIWLYEYLNRRNKWLRYSVFALVVLFTIPTSMATLYNHYLPNRPPAKISKSELEALDFLSKLPVGVVLTQPFDKNASQNWDDIPPKPLYLYESTAYVSASSNKPVYLEDRVNLEITGYGWQQRNENITNFFNPNVFVTAADFFHDKNIRYVYVVKKMNYDVEKMMYLKKIFENDEIVIYEN